ncbi:rust resistance kinase Lr10-like protein [Cinnamomum micranthum f. kanehirae]|uniref:non-specific serine/threonine protein kinase n=1 Tax=Cinnamomum micranthum f. kanehirae TaxID=337451 RepID=A0A3S3NJN8_9MAGN|nr:rust resistance kinase Lr10-like protein [Cinnamomum micranthum f. kanehirae]
MGSLEQSIFFRFLSLLLSLPLIIEYPHAYAHSCEPVRCDTGYGPLIKFPFRIKGLHHPRCGYPGFDLYCKDNYAFIHFPLLGRDVIVERIDYEYQTLTIVAEKNCLWNLLFTSSNFTSSRINPDSWTLHTLLNCSKKGSFVEEYVNPISCLSDAEHEALVVFGEDRVGSLPVSCRPIKTISVPRLYPFNLNLMSATQLTENNISEYIYFGGDGDGLNLVWYVPGCIDCESSGNNCGYRDNNSSETLCLPPPPRPPHKGSKRQHVIIVSSMGTLLLLTSLVITIKFYCYWKSRRQLDLENENEVEKFLENYKYLKPIRYSYADLKRMTGQFKEILGQGGYGCVYKGILSNGTLVAVKILKSFDIDGGEFINEVGTMGKIHHVNVVRLLGFCADRLKRALIYEFMPNESLEKHIFSKSSNDCFLGWEKLQNIAIGIARGIEYIHQGCDQRILHFDIKPHNILLDQNFNPKISDFGLAKLCSKGQSVVSMTKARGTMGYIAPEVFSRNFGNVSYKSDVYSYGMLLLEMVSGRQNTDITEENTSRVFFPEWIYKRLCQGEDMGLELQTDEDAHIAKKLTIVALWCIQWYPVDRPPMRSVVHMLKGSMENLTMPSNPFISSLSGNKDTKNSCITNLSVIPE